MGGLSQKALINLFITVKQTFSQNFIQFGHLVFAELHFLSQKPVF